MTCKHNILLTADQDHAKIPMVTITSEHRSLEILPGIALPAGKWRMKCITHLAEALSRAIGPYHSTNRRFDKILFLNDVIYSGSDVANLSIATVASDTNRHDVLRGFLSCYS